jgi:hypothetical protein
MLFTNNAKLYSGTETRDFAATHFISLPGAMFTSMQFSCLDSVAAIYRPLLARDSFVLIPYFCLLGIAVPIVPMKLVTAAIVGLCLPSRYVELV